MTCLFLTSTGLQTAECEWSRGCFNQLGYRKTRGKPSRFLYTPITNTVQPLAVNSQLLKLTITRLSHDLLIRFSRISDNYHRLGLVAEADITDWSLENSPYHAKSKIESKNTISSQTLQCLETFPVSLRGWILNFKNGFSVLWENSLNPFRGWIPLKI